MLFVCGCHSSLVSSRSLFDVCLCCSLFVVCCLLCVVCSLLSCGSLLIVVVCCLVFVVCRRLLLVVRCFVAGCSLRGVCWPCVVVRYVLLVVCRSSCVVR